MAKRKPAARDESEDLVHVLIPLDEACVLLGVAADLEDNEHYAERARALITAARRHVDAALALVEGLRERGGKRKRGGGAT